MLLIAGLSMAAAGQDRAGFRAAVATENITPHTPQWLRGYNPRLSTGVLDSIFHRIVVLDDGQSQFYLVSSEVVGIPAPEYDRMADILKKQLGIDRVNFWWSVTHTHSAPEIATHFQGIPYPSMANRSRLAADHEPDTAYTAFFERKLVDGIKAARARLAPARLGVGWGHSQANINRRAIDVDGKASLGLNPDGEVDKMIGLIKIDGADGRPMALIANYPIHGTVLGQQSTLISGDAPGVVARYVEENTGAPLLFLNGAAGDLAPIYSVYPDHRSGHLSQFRTLLGDKILEANEKISTTDDEVKLLAKSIVVETPRRAGLGWPDDLARYARTDKSGQALVRLPVRFLRVGDKIAIWSAPVEMFCAIAKEVRERSPFPYTFYFGYTNGSLGYLPSAAAWGAGGYEPGVSPFTPAAHADVRETVSAYLDGELLGAPPRR